jgi:hypothetical protein
MSVQWIKATESDSLGKFEIPMSIRDQFQATEKFAPLLLRIAATARGHGFGWADIEIDQPNHDLKLRLAEDVIVQGNFVTTAGNPIADVEVSVVDVTHPDPLPDSETLIESGAAGSGVYTNWSMWMGGPPQSKTVVTDANGAFAMYGLSTERYLRLQARGDSIADTRLSIVTRPPPTDLKSGMIGARSDRAESNYFSEFTHIAVSGRTITG